MQLAAGEVISKGKNLKLLAKTGTGKTLAYLIPIVNALPQKDGEVRCLIIVPSRELALQVERTFRQMGSGLKVLSCYGGHSVREEINSFKNAPTVIIGTPGRLAQHIDERSFNESTIDFLVIDEFDKCLELGFLDDISYIHKYLKGLKQHVFTSATPLIQFPDFIDAENVEELDFLDRAITQSKIAIKVVDTQDIYGDLFKLLCFVDGKQTVVFTNERAVVEDVADFLHHKGLQCSIYHGKLEQDVRERELLKFANGSTNILISTDLAGRGLDIPGVANIIHFQMPINEQSFVHRNGRTARMNADGNAYVFRNQFEELKYLEDIEIFELEENYKLPYAPKWQTLYFSAGRKDKLSKGDLVGFLMKIGGLTKDEIGIIDVKDRTSYVAISSENAQSVLKAVTNQKIKGKKIKIELAK